MNYVRAIMDHEVASVNNTNDENDDDVDASIVLVQNLTNFVEGERGERGYDENMRDIFGNDHIDAIIRGMSAMYSKEWNFKELLKQKDDEIAKLKKIVPGKAIEINKANSSSGTWDITTINKEQEQ